MNGTTNIMCIYVVTANIDRYCDCYINGDISYKEKCMYFTYPHTCYMSVRPVRFFSQDFITIQNINFEAPLC